MSAVSKQVCRMPLGWESLVRGINSMNWRSLTLMYATEILSASENSKASSKPKSDKSHVTFADH